MKNVIRFLPFCCAVSVLFGCANQAFILPAGIRSSTHQYLVADAVEEAFESLDLTDLQGKRVYLEVNALSERESAESPEETYIKRHLKNELIKVGAKPEDEEARSDISLVVSAVAGTDFIHREILFFYYSDLTKGQVKYKAVLYDASSGKVLSMKEGGAEEEYRESYILGFIGPFH